MKRFPAVRIALIFSLILNISLFDVCRSFHTSVQLDKSGRLAFKLGHTIPGRSLDATGNGMAYHFTRYDSYKTSDWKPKTP